MILLVHEDIEVETEVDSVTLELVVFLDHFGAGGALWELLSQLLKDTFNDVLQLRLN